MARRFAELGFAIKATLGTQEFLAEHGIQSERAYKMREKRPNIADVIVDGEIQLVINTSIGGETRRDGFYIRRNALRYKVPYATTTAGGNE